MRSKLIITGAIGVLAAATLTVNAQNAAGRTNASRPTSAAPGARTVAADREEVAIFVHATPSPVVATSAARPDTDESSRPDVDTKPAAPALGTACQAAIATLKTMHQAEVAEDAAERTKAESETPLVAAANDRTEDAAEAQGWIAALHQARVACTPAPLARCLPAISSLDTALQALRAQEAAETPGAEVDAAADFAAVRAAFSVVAMSCAARE